MVQFSRQAVAWLVAFGNAVIHSVTTAEKILHSRGWHQWQIVRFSDYIIKLFYLLLVICWSLRKEFGFTQWIPMDPVILLSCEVCASVAWHHGEYLGAQWVFPNHSADVRWKYSNLFLTVLHFPQKKNEATKNAVFVLLHCPFVPCERGGEQLGFFIRVIKQPSYKGSNFLCAQTKHHSDTSCLDYKPSAQPKKCKKRALMSSLATRTKQMVMLSQKIESAELNWVCSTNENSAQKNNFRRAMV